MSLFKCREWWRAPPTPDEEFDLGSLCVANIDNSPDSNLKVITGSFQGMLRIYMPTERGYKVEHQLLEMELPEAILQVEAGVFTTNHPGLTLAILHPRKVAVYSVSAVAGSSGSATHFDLRKLYEHFLEHSSANMCFGSFGSNQTLDSLCVQSLDGQLSFFEGETLAFNRFLPNFLLPGPLAYIRETDSFVTANSAMVLECYKFSVLVASSAEKPSESANSPSASLTAAKKLQADWSVIIGENVLNIRIARMSKGLTAQQADILILGEHNLYLMSDQGQMRMQKRLDYPPACICTFENGSMIPGGRSMENAMLGSSTANLLVYKESQLVWNTTCDEVPVALSVAEFCALKGLVVSLSDNGGLSLNFMGTNPPLSVVGGFESKELDYVAMDDEHRQLLATIREATSSTTKEPSERLHLRAQVPTALDPATGSQWDDPAAISVTARIFVSFIGNGSANDITFAASAPPPFTAVLSESMVSSVGSRSRTPVVVPVTLQLTGTTLPAGNTVTVTATYLKDGGNPRVATCTFQVPLVLLCTAIPPVKNAAFKVTLDTNRLPPALPALFDDVLAISPSAAEAARGATGGNALTFQCYSGECVTVLVSKNAGRYRLQSDQFEAMWIVADELSRRLTAYYQGPGASAGGGSGPFQVSFTEAIPLQDYWTLVDTHFAARGRVLAIRKQLSSRAHEMRSVQKRLLVRFKDRNPMPLGSMDTLLETTYSDIMSLGDQWQEEQASLDTASAALAGATQLILLLTRFRFALGNEADEILRAHLSPLVRDTVVTSTRGEMELEFHGWEEMTESAMTQLLRSCLARSSKESAAQVAPMAELTDTSKLKKHISLVLERLSKGGQLASPS